MSYRRAFVAYLKENSPYKKSLTKQNQKWLYEFNKLLFFGTSDLLSKQIDDVETYARIRREVFKDSYSYRVSITKRQDKLTEYLDYIYRPVEGDETLVEVIDLYRSIKTSAEKGNRKARVIPRPAYRARKKRDLFFDPIQVGAWTGETAAILLDGVWGTTLYNFSDDLSLSKNNIASLILKHRLQYFRVTAEQEAWIESNRLLSGNGLQPIFLPLETLMKLSRLLGSRKAAALVGAIEARHRRK